jgi:hypothetical protein
MKQAMFQMHGIMTYVLVAGTVDQRVRVLITFWSIESNQVCNRKSESSRITNGMNLSSFGRRARQFFNSTSIVRNSYEKSGWLSQRKQAFLVDRGAKAGMKEEGDDLSIYVELQKRKAYYYIHSIRIAFPCPVLGMR